MKRLPLVPLAVGLALLVAAALVHVVWPTAEDKGEGVTLALPPARPAPPLPRVQGPAGAPLLLIDPGHGGYDPGASSVDGAAREKDVTLALAVSIRDAALAGGRMRVALTRDDDRYVALGHRADLARRLDADLFLSIHADSAGNPDARGASLYTLADTASDRAAARMAARENSAEPAAALDPSLQALLDDLAARGALERALAFARLVRDQAQPVLPFRGEYRRYGNFVVLRTGAVPAVLLEVGYLSNAEDSRFLLAADTRAAVAERVRRAAMLYFARFPEE